MGYYNKFTIDEEWRPVVVTVKTDGDENGNVVFDLPPMTPEEWTIYWEAIKEFYKKDLLAILQNPEHEEEQITITAIET